MFKVVLFVAAQTADNLNFYKNISKYTNSDIPTQWNTTHQ